MSTTRFRFAAVVILTMCSFMTTALDVEQAPIPSNSVTMVSGYWKIPSKHEFSEYNRWMSRSLRIQCPLVFFYGDEQTRIAVEAIRNGTQYQTILIHRDLNEMKNRFSYGSDWIHPTHMSNPLLAVIWLDKVFMMAEAAAMNPFHSDWFAWNGNCWTLKGS